MNGPTHLVRNPGDKRSICGVKKPLPVCWAEKASAHRYPHERCAACFEAAGLADMLTCGEEDDVRALTASQALACELAATGRCRCRCRGALHGASRVADVAGIEALPEGDPHSPFGTWEQMPLPGFKVAVARA